MSKSNFYNGFKDRFAYKAYRLESMDLEIAICLAREEEEMCQTPFWMRIRYLSIRDVGKRMIGYIRCLWDFDIIDEETFDSLYDAYSQLIREAGERINELSEE